MDVLKQLPAPNIIISFNLALALSLARSPLLAVFPHSWPPLSKLDQISRRTCNPLGPPLRAVPDHYTARCAYYVVLSSLNFLQSTQVEIKVAFAVSNSLLELQRAGQCPTDLSRPHPVSISSLARSLCFTAPPDLTSIFNAFATLAQ